MKSSSRIILAVAAGAIVGTALTLLLTPKKGSEVRDMFRQKGKKISEGVREVFGEVKERIAAAKDSYKQPEYVD